MVVSTSIYIYTYMFVCVCVFVYITFYINSFVTYFGFNNIENTCHTKNWNTVNSVLEEML